MIFRLAIKSRVVDEGIDKDAEMIFDLVIADLGPTLILLLDSCCEVLDDLLGSKIDVCSSFRSADSVDERNLHEGSILRGVRHSHFPFIVDLFKCTWGVDTFVGFDVILEGLDRKL